MTEEKKIIDLTNVRKSNEIEKIHDLVINKDFENMTELERMELFIKTIEMNNPEGLKDVYEVIKNHATLLEKENIKIVFPSPEMAVTYGNAILKIIPDKYSHYTVQHNVSVESQFFTVEFVSRTDTKYAFIPNEDIDAITHKSFNIIRDELKDVEEKDEE